MKCPPAWRTCPQIIRSSMAGGKPGTTSPGKILLSSSPQALSGAGVLESVPGPAGGYRLARPAEKISLLDIVLAVEGREPAFRCAEIRRRGPNPLPQRYFTRPCQINAAMLKAEKAYRAGLAKVSVADLLADLGADDDGGIAARGCAFLELHERKTGNRASS